MSALISSVAAAALTATMSVTGAGAAATTPASAATLSPAAYVQNPPAPRPNPPHNFRVRFKNEAQCRARAAHDHPGRPGDWDCRRGPDRNNPWEYWGR